MSSARLIAVPDSSPVARQNSTPARLKARLTSVVSPRAALRAPLVVIVDNPQDCEAGSGERYISAADFLHEGAHQFEAGTIIINLCRSYKYLSVGYYCSLLAEARGQVVLPAVKTINDLSRKAVYRLALSALEATLNQLLSAVPHAETSDGFALDIYFGLTAYQPLAALAQQIFDCFPVPLLRVEIERRGNWQITRIKLLSVMNIAPDQEPLCRHGLAHFQRRGFPQSGITLQNSCHLAILQDPQEVLPPSNRGALDQFVQIGRQLGMQVSLIEKKDFSHLAQYDALFIRETTAINHHTYLFAKKAASEDLVVIDDADSIRRCTNKVYLCNLLHMNKIPMPRSYVLQKDDLVDISELELEIGYPMVMKIPDGAFSHGISKVNNAIEFVHAAQQLLKQSSLILVQEYLYTEFDWRIGVLNRRAIFASQYFMSAGHWQIARRDADGNAEFGKTRAVPLHEVPPQLLEYAVRAANLIGDGLYGVDMKMCRHGPVVIEVNDNPNIDQGVEDGILGEQLYRTVLLDMQRRLQLKQQAVAC
jgi:glutathione synthase/RimK-type ligase-like ATP-grasp enzyme